MKKKKNGNNKLMMNNLVFTWVSIAVALLFTAMVGTAIYGFVKGDDKEIRDVREVNRVVAIPIQELSDRRVKFFRFNLGPKEIVFFAVRGPDGNLHTAFDACEVCCFRKRTGYIQEGAYMVCLGCRERYAINMIDQVNGVGCRPQCLEHREEGRNLYVKVSDLKRGARFFP